MGNEGFKLLTSKLEKQSTVTVDVILYDKYRMKNKINRREPREFIQRIIRSAKNAGFTKTKIQFDIVYNVIEFELHHDFRCFDNAAILSSYLTSMDNYKNFWWIYANKYKQPGGGGNNQTAKFRIQYENKFQQYGHGYQYGQRIQP